MNEWQPEHDDYVSGYAHEPYELGADPKRDALNCELYWAWKKFRQRCSERNIIEGTRQYNFHFARFSDHLRRKLEVESVTPDGGYIQARKKWEEQHTPAPPCAVNR